MSELENSQADLIAAKAAANKAPMSQVDKQVAAGLLVTLFVTRVIPMVAGLKKDLVRHEPFPAAGAEVKERGSEAAEIIRATAVKPDGSAQPEILAALTSATTLGESGEKLEASFATMSTELGEAVRYFELGQLALLAYLEANSEASEALKTARIAQGAVTEHIDSYLNEIS